MDENIKHFFERAFDDSAMLEGMVQAGLCEGSSVFEIPIVYKDKKDEIQNFLEKKGYSTEILCRIEKVEDNLQVDFQQYFLVRNNSGDYQNA
jgi:hypothetical protein